MPEARALWEEWKMWRLAGVAVRTWSTADLLAFEELAKYIDGKVKTDGS